MVVFPYPCPFSTSPKPTPSILSFLSFKSNPNP
jgi:hypothetical protein